LVCSSAFCQSKFLLDFASDTTIISMPDSQVSDNDKLNFVKDARPIAGRFFALIEKTKWLVIPVDHYVIFNAPLASIAESGLRAVAAPSGCQRLVIDNLTYWKKENAFLHGGYFLNGYTRLIDSTGNTIQDWQWEFREKKAEKEMSKRIRLLIDEWIREQAVSIQKFKAHPFGISPRTYRRELKSWVDCIYLEDGFILDSRIMLDFPTDQKDRYIRGASGIYFRQSSKHQSIAIGGLNRQHYFRAGDSFLFHVNVTGRIGFNTYRTGKFEYVNPWNILLVNMGLTQTFEYHPRFHRGIFAGIGLHQSINLLPEILDLFEPGLVMTIGVTLP
jgi:hypothetical protein